jgi:hypothetical protein
MTKNQTKGGENKMDDQSAKQEAHSPTSGEYKVGITFNPGKNPKEYEHGRTEKIHDTREYALCGR